MLQLLGSKPAKIRVLELASPVHLLTSMKRLLCAAAVFSFLATGCIVHRHPHYHTGSRARTVVVREPSCHPSQYWDGHTCRHKGKGHGARKHDGR